MFSCSIDSLFVFYRVFVVVTFAMLVVGRSMAMIPDYSKGKKAALRILRLNKRQSEINPCDDSGLILVRHMLRNVSYRCRLLQYVIRTI
jgi:hypothetical protein